MSIREWFSADATAPASARSLFAQALDGMGRGPSLAADAALVVTELVTNAVNAGASQVVVELTAGVGHIRIAVSDDAAGQPRMVEHVPEQSPHGRGLQIVNVTARRWGTVPLAQGKQVWAELST